MTFPAPADGDREKVDRLVQQLRMIPNPSDKDILVFIFLWQADLRPLDPASRISPAIFLQPHFPNIYYSLTFHKKMATLDSEEYRKIRNSPIFKGFPYIKTFTPIRRLTTSYGGTVKFMYGRAGEKHEDGKIGVVSNVLLERVLNRSFMIDPQDRLFQDSVLVRFEDGKLNPKATFTALCAFLDLPYTDSMTYCSYVGYRDPLEFDTNVRGFDPDTVYRTYDEYVGDPERYYLEYFMRDIYEYCGYDFHYYDGAEMDMDKITAVVDKIEVENDYMRKTWIKVCEKNAAEMNFDDPKNAEYVGKSQEEIAQSLLEKMMVGVREERLRAAKILLRGLRFINKNGQPLRMMPKLKLDPDLLEQPLYH